MNTAKQNIATNDGFEDENMFTLGLWDIVAIVAYFTIVMGIGFSSMFRSNRNTVAGFFLAGRYMFWLPVGASLFASNIGSEHFIGLSGLGAASGIGVGAFEFNALILLQLLGFVFLPVYIASKVSTLPEYMKKRFGGERIRMYLALLSMILYVFTKISVNLFSGAIFIQQALQWNIYFSILIILTMTTLCTVVGGLAAVIYIDVVQVAIMISGSFILLFKGLNQVGGWQALQEKYMMAIPDKTFLNPNNNGTCGVPGYDSWKILREPFESDLPWPGFLLGQTPASIWYWCADQVMYIVQFQKALSARSLSHAQGATILTGWLKILPVFLIVIPGMISRVLYPNEVGCVDPEICQKVCQNPVSCSNIAYPRLVLGLMPEGLRGIMISVMLAALMSDLTSIFNSSSTLFTMDIYRKLRANAKNKELLLVGRLCILVLVVISILWIPIVQEMQGGQLFSYIQAISAYLSPPIAMIFCISVIWKRMNETGAFWGLMVGLIIGLLRMILDFTYKAPPCMEIDDRPHIVKDIHYMYFAAFLFWISGIVSIVISLLTPPGEDYRLIRTTFFTRKYSQKRPDEKYYTSSNLDVEMDLLNKEITPREREIEESSNQMQRNIFKNLCSVQDEEAEEQNKALELHLEEMSTLKQTNFQKIILWINLGIILIIALFLYTYFSINPFTIEKIDFLRRKAFDLKSNNFTTMLN